MVKLADFLYDLAVRQTSLQLRQPGPHALGRITMAGFLKNHTTAPLDRPRVLGQYATVYIVDGTGTYADANGCQRAIRPGDLILVFPELAHTYGSRDPRGWTEFFLVFEGPVFDLWRQRGLLNSRQPVWHLEPIPYWLSKFESVLGAPANRAMHPPCSKWRGSNWCSRRPPWAANIRRRTDNSSTAPAPCSRVTCDASSTCTNWRGTSEPHRTAFASDSHGLSENPRRITAAA